MPSIDTTHRVRSFIPLSFYEHQTYLVLSASELTLEAASGDNNIITCFCKTLVKIWGTTFFTVS